MTDPSNEPQITAHDLRAALARQGSPRRPSTLLSGHAGDWEWEPGVSVAERAELDELRDTVTRQREQLAELGRAHDSATAQAHALREALGSLARTPPWRRRGTINALRARGLLDGTPAKQPAAS
jgi:hypothetical protein